MKSSSNDEAVISSRRSFISGAEISDRNVRREILDSWERSKMASVDPNTPLLPPPHVKEAQKVWDDEWEFYKPAAIFNFNRFYDLLKETGSVVFYIDMNLTIISQRGSENMLKYLNSMNIGLGASLKENAIGTNAAALALYEKSAAHVVGAEHYIEALQDCACIANFLYNERDIHRGFIMYVTPKDDFHYSQIGMVSHFAALMLTSIKLDKHKVELSMAHDYIDMSIQQNDRGIIFVDRRGIILGVNNFLVDSGLCAENVSGSIFEEMFPELISATDCIKAGRSIHLYEAHFDRPQNRKKFFMDCQPIEKEGIWVGMIVTLHDSQRINKNVARLANFNAHYVFDDLIGSNLSFVNIKKAAQNAAQSPSSILITGESGTGKELFAQAIHNASNRANGPFISINCAAIPRELIGSELFGYMEGAFTGARKGGTPGKFELADKGSIFLDEIGEMPLDMQTVLLRVLEEKTITRLGGNLSIPIDVKLIAATNRDLSESIGLKQFRLDLYYRLNVINIEIPPLRERKDDIPLLTNYFLKQFNKSLGKKIAGITPECMELLRNYDWPGNIRELRNVIERGINQSNSPFLTANDLPKDILVAQLSSRTDFTSFDVRHQELDIDKSNLFGQFQSNERKRILDLLEKHNGNKARVAKELGITRATLYRRLKARE